MPFTQSTSTPPMLQVASSTKETAANAKVPLLPITEIRKASVTGKSLERSFPILPNLHINAYITNTILCEASAHLNFLKAHPYPPSIFPDLQASYSNYIKNLTSFSQYTAALLQGTKSHEEASKKAAQPLPTPETGGNLMLNHTPAPIARMLEERHNLSPTEKAQLTVLFLHLAASMTTQIPPNLTPGPTP